MQGILLHPDDKVLYTIENKTESVTYDITFSQKLTICHIKPLKNRRIFILQEFMLSVELT